MIEVISIHEETARDRTLSVLRDGGVVGLPTDTVYGLIADAGSADAIEKMFQIKGRARTNPLSIFVSDVAMARTYAQISDEQARMLEKVWPGGVTVLLVSKKNLPDILTAGGSLLGLRISNDPFIMELLAAFNAPLAQTSANPSGWSPAADAEAARIYFSEKAYKPDLLIADERSCESCSASTVVDLTQASPHVTREGAVSLEELNKLLSYN